MNFRNHKLVAVGPLEMVVPVLMTIAVLFVLVLIVNYILIKTVRKDFLKYKTIDRIER